MTLLRGFTVLTNLYLSISLIGLWIFFTHLYGIIVSNPEKIEENFEWIHEDFNGTSFQSNEDLFNSTHLNQSEIIDVQKKYLYREGLSTAAKLMMLYPIGAVGFSQGSFLVRNFQKSQFSSAPFRPFR